MRKKNGYWTYETCMEESRKYTIRNEFRKGCKGAYKVAWKNGWLDEFTWLKLQCKPNGYWNYNTCMEESRNYTTRSEFAKRSGRAYKLSCKNGWIDEYTWLEDGKAIASKKRIKWTYETCMEEAHKYTSRSEFQSGNGSAYQVARKNGWFDEFTWLKDGRFDIIRDKIDSVYVYEFKELNCAYVGRTLMRRKKDRDREHIFNTDNDAVAKFAKERNISVPKPIYLEENLTLEDGKREEEYWFNKYKEDGWTMLNRAKTGSIGGLGKGKWTYETCMEEAHKYTSRSEFQKGDKGAYLAAWKNGWLDEYTWLELQCKPRGHWTYETCIEESRNYTTRNEFRNGGKGAYRVACKNGWINEFFPK